MKRNFSGILIGVSSMLLLLSACAQVPGEAESLSIREARANESISIPGGIQNMSDHADVIDKNTIALTLYGSSSCPPTPVSSHFFLSEGEKIVDVQVDRGIGQERVCTMDYAPHTYILESRVGSFDSSTFVRTATDIHDPDEQNHRIVYPQNPEPDPIYTVDPVEPMEPDTPVDDSDGGGSNSEPGSAPSPGDEPMKPEKEIQSS